MKDIQITSDRKEMVEIGKSLWKKRRIFTHVQCGKLIVIAIEVLKYCVLA